MYEHFFSLPYTELVAWLGVESSWLKTVFPENFEDIVLFSSKQAMLLMRSIVPFKHFSCIWHLFIYLFIYHLGELLGSGLYHSEVLL